MVRNIRTEASSVNMDEMTFASNRSNVHRGNHTGPIVERSGRHRMFNSNADPSRGSPNLLGHLPPISQFLALEPLPMMDQRCMQSGDLRKVLVNGTAREAPAKLSNSVPVEELKRLKSSVLDTSIKARGRVKKMDECLHKVNKYGKALNCMRQQTNESSNERSGGSSLLRMGSQIPRNSVEFVNQSLEDRTKSISLNKRIRSSMAENRSEGQASTIMRQPLFIGKDRDAEGSDTVEENIRKLPGGGESWEKKMRRKRSIRNVFSRAMDSDGELEKVTQKMNNVSGVQVSKGFRLVIDEDTAIENPAPPMKGKASRASRIGLTMAADSSSSLQSPSKVHITNGSNNRKRAMPSGSSPIARWGSQKPQKMFRTRRTNLVSLLSNHDEVPTSADGCTSGLGTKEASVSRTFSSCISSPARLSESEESAADESQESMGIVVRKSNLKKGGNGGGLQKEGRNSQGSLTGSPLVVKLEIGNSKPLKNGSKSRRPPLKKLSDRKGFSRPSKTLTSSDLEFAGESDDDLEELHAAACSASSASYNACSGTFWKKMENLFSSIRRDDLSYLEQQVKKSSDESHKNLLKNSSNDQVELARPGNSIDQVETEGMKLPLYGRVLAALIIEEDVAIQDKGEGRKSKDNDGFGCNQFMANLQLPSQPNFERYAGTSNPPSQKMTYGEFCGNSLQDRLAALSNGMDISCDEEYLEKPIESELLTELHNIGLSPDNVPDLADGDEGIDNEISYLQKKHMEKVSKNKALLSQLFKVVKEEDEQMKQHSLEQTAMDMLVETAYRKQLATRASYASKHGIPKVSKHVAANFAKRTLDRCRKFEETGQSCFGESPFCEVLSAPPPSLGVQTGSDTLLVSGQYGGKKANFGHLADTIGSVPSRGKKKELVAIDEAAGGNVSFGISTSFGNTGKRSKNGKFKGNQKTKSKFKSKTKKIARLETTSSSHADVQTESNEKISKDASKEKKDSADLMNKLDLQMDSIGDLDVQSWLNFEGDDGPQDDYSMGLEIPMDDLSDIFA